MEMSSQTLESMLVSAKSQQEKKPRPPEEAVKCPRCESANTKFCYYNNYSLTQPRYFCKSCRRYWTKGGTLRNVPVGGGCRRNKRSSLSSSSSSSIKRSHDQPLTNSTATHSPITPLSYDSNDLSLAFARLQKHATGQTGFESHLSLPANTNDTQCDFIGHSGVTASSAAPGFLDAQRSDFLQVPNGFHNIYYGKTADGHMRQMENCGIGVHVSEEMSIPFEDSSGRTAVNKVKQEFNIGREGENRVLWGFPWQFGGNGNMGNMDSGRQGWNGLGSSIHGLLYSPLM